MSSWLVFMKERLLMAKRLLKKGGTIWISIGEDGMHYLKVLSDDILAQNILLELYLDVLAVANQMFLLIFSRF